VGNSTINISADAPSDFPLNNLKQKWLKVKWAKKIIVNFTIYRKRSGVISIQNSIARFLDPVKILLGQGATGHQILG